MALRDYTRDIFSGRTIYRILLHRLVRRFGVVWTGRGLDLGAPAETSYRRFLSPELTVVTADLHPRQPGIPSVDLNAPLPYADGSFDVVLCLNALYIVDDPAALLREAHRVMRPGGRLVLAVPFVAPEMPEPHDYCRWTAEGLTRLIRSAGFELEVLERFGERATVIAYLLHPAFLFNSIRFITSALALLGDWLVPRGVRTAHPTPLGYFILARP